MKQQRGSTFIEVLLAVSIIATVLTAVMSMMAMSLHVAQANEQRQLALQKAQETGEFFKRERALNSWSNFAPSTMTGAYCLVSLPDSIATMSTFSGNCNSGESFQAAGFTFYREVTILKPDPSTADVHIELRWTEGNQDKNLGLDQQFKEY